MISDRLKTEFLKSIDFNPEPLLKKKESETLPVDYFDFYNSQSGVYSSKIEGEDIDFDSFFKHKFLGVRYNPDYTRRADDLFDSYQFILKNKLERNNVFAAHSLLSKHLLPPDQRGQLRTNLMFVVNDEDRIEYVACDPEKVNVELKSFFDKVEDLTSKKLTFLETFFYAAQIHLVFVKIHPMQDRNGRMGRLLEKWFLIEHLGRCAHAVELEKNYFLNKKKYYANIRKLGLEYSSLDWSRSLDFLRMTVMSLKEDTHRAT